MTITIPVNSTATVYVPAQSKDNVTADGATFVPFRRRRESHDVGFALRRIK